MPTWLLAFGFWLLLAFGFGFTWLFAFGFCCFFGFWYHVAFVQIECKCEILAPKCSK